MSIARLFEPARRMRSLLGAAIGQLLVGERVPEQMRLQLRHPGETATAAVCVQGAAGLAVREAVAQATALPSTNATSWSNSSSRPCSKGVPAQGTLEPAIHPETKKRERSPSPMQCDTCGSYAHPYLSACPGCGAPLESRFETVLGEWLVRSQPRPREEAEAVARGLYKSGWDEFAEEEKEEEIQRLQAESAWEARRSLVEFIAGQPDSVVDRIRTEKGAQIGTVGLRYFGGLPGHPSEIDVHVELGHDQLRIFGSSGSIMAAVPIASILAAVEFDAETSLGWYGLWFGSVVSFATPKIETSGWLVTYAIDGTMHQFAVGARKGLFSRKPLPGFFRRSAHMALERHPAIDAMEAELGPIEYAKALGLNPAMAPG